MSSQTEAKSPVRLEQLAALHELTKYVGKHLRSQLRTYLDALAPLFRPRRVLGDFIEGTGKESIAGTEQNLNELREQYFKVCSSPFDLRRELKTPIESISTQIQICEWEYLHEARTERDHRNITVISPLSWVILYPSTYNLTALRQAITGKQDRSTESIRAFVLRACLMNLLFTKQPALTTLFEGLRLQVEVRRQPQLGDLPLLTLSASVRTERPADDVLLTTTGFSGRPVFQEVVSPGEIENMTDPVKQQLGNILARHNALT
jgi:hypothetical protein